VHIKPSLNIEPYGGFIEVNVGTPVEICEKSVYHPHQAIVGANLVFALSIGRIQDSPLRNKPNWPKQ